jgi:hypothetical protein
LQPITSGETAKTRYVRSREPVFERVRSLARETVTKIEAGSLRKVLGSRVIEVTELETLRVLGESLAEDPVGRAARAILLRAAYMCEKSSAYGAYVLCKRLSEDITIESHSRLNREIVSRVSERIMGRRGSHGLLESLDSAGPLSTLVVREGKSSHIRIVDSLDLPVSPISEFGDNIELRNVRILCHDGVIESVSEINVVLERCIASEIPLVIYARGYGYEVVSTLLHNWRTGKLRVLPVSAVGSDIQNFFFVDIPKISSDEITGMSLRERFDSLRTAAVVRLGGNVLSIEDPEFSKRSREVVKELMSEEIPRDSVTFMQERTRRLSSRRIELWVGNDHGDSSGIYRDRLDQLIRFILHSRRSGVFSIKSRNGPVFVPSGCLDIAEETFSSLRIESNTRHLVVNDE